MGEPNLLKREFSVEIHPAILLLNCLTEMKELTSRALLIVKGENEFQILAPILNRGSCAMDMKSDRIFAPSNSDGYSLVIDIPTWLHHLYDPIVRGPSSSLTIMKMSRSIDLVCLFRNHRQLIRLGPARFLISQALTMNIQNCHVRVTMTSQQFREFIQGFADSGHELLFTREFIRWITPSGHHDYPAQGYQIEGLTTPGASFHIRVRWELPVYNMLCSLSIGCDRVELSVFANSRGVRLYRFRFLSDSGRFMFCYTDKENVPPLSLVR